LTHTTNDTRNGPHPYELLSWELEPNGGLQSWHVPRPRPWAPTGLQEDGMWSDAVRARECGVTRCGRLISLKGAVAHFFLSFFLFLPHATTCSCFPNKRRTTHFSHNPLVLSCRCAPPARRRPCPAATCCQLTAVPVLVLPATGSPSDPAPLHFLSSLRSVFHYGFDHEHHLFFLACSSNVTVIASLSAPATFTTSLVALSSDRIGVRPTMPT